MNETELKKIQASLLIIMDEIDALCRKHGIKYSLFAGSLLGAVRHKGIIPWDDDIDICMPRKDYDRFFEICSNELNSKFGIVTIFNTRHFGYGFSKVVLKGTRIKQNGLMKGNNIFELWIDVFPYDNVPNNKIKMFFHNYYNYLLVKLLEERYDGIFGKSGIVKRVCFIGLHFLNWLIQADSEKNWLINNMTRFNNDTTKEITCLASPYKYIKECLPSNFFENLTEYDFCGRKYYGYKDFDYYLNKIYGDYMKIPPPEERHTHNLEIIDLGVYAYES